MLFWDDISMTSFCRLVGTEADMAYDVADDVVDDVVGVVIR